MQRNRQTDSVALLKSSLKHFEKKLDQLQHDVNTHGNTLSELRVMVTKLAIGTDFIKPVGERRKTVALQYETERKPRFIPERKARFIPDRKIQRQRSPLARKAKSYEGQKKIGMIKFPLPVRAPKKVSLPVVSKLHRPQKIDDSKIKTKSVLGVSAMSGKKTLQKRAKPN